MLVGAGTGQFLDYALVDFLRGHRLTFTDINATFLARLIEWLKRVGLEHAQVFVDDTEATQLAGPFDAVFVALVLEHISWRAGVQAISALKSGDIHINIQRNPADFSDAVSPGRASHGSMQVFANTAKPTFIPADDLIAATKLLGFNLQLQMERSVADGKAMVGLTFATQSVPIVNPY